MAKSMEQQFCEALKEGETDKAIFLTEFLGKKINKLYEGKTPLMWAVEARDLKVVEKLIELGADINIKNNEGMSALNIAFNSLSGDIVEKLLENGATLDASRLQKNIILMGAAYVGDEKIIEKLVEYVDLSNLDLNVTDASNRTPLMLAIIRGNSGVAQGLIGLGADVNIKDVWNRSPLMMAIETGDLATASVLLDFVDDVDIDAKDELGRNALMRAVFLGHVDIAKKLIERGADVKAKDNQGVAVLEFAQDENVRKAIFEAIKKKYQPEPEGKLYQNSGRFFR